MNHQVLFFDGVCNLCNAWVDFVFKHDPTEKIKVASLQSEYAKGHLPSEFTKLLHSLVYQKGVRLYTRSQAVIELLKDLGGVWTLLALLISVVPRFLRDAIYDFIASRRYRWFGERNTCRLPTEQERQRFLS